MVDYSMCPRVCPMDTKENHRHTFHTSKVRLPVTLSRYSLMLQPNAATTSFLYPYDTNCPSLP